jgi:hypothetical protein
MARRAHEREGKGGIGRVEQRGGDTGGKEGEQEGRDIVVVI